MMIVLAFIRCGYAPATDDNQRFRRAVATMPVQRDPMIAFLLSALCNYTGLCGTFAQTPAFDVARACRTVEHLGAKHTVCSYPVTAVEVRMFLDDDEGAPYARLPRLRAALPAPPAMLMNGGMYRHDLSAVGLYVEGGEQAQRLSTKDGWGNFHLLPNGVFWSKDGKLGVTETQAYAKADPKPDFATQSGPMLVIDGKLHPRFIEGSDSLKVRNGVGLSDDGATVHFALSHGAVNFHDFGTLFRDELKADNALFLDGTVSAIEAPGVKRGGFWKELGPMIGVFPKG